MMRRLSKPAALIGAAISMMTASAAAAQVDAAAARALFDEADAACAADGGALWGVSLCGPLLLVDPATRQAAASQADAAGVLTASGGVYTGVLPAGVVLANTAVDWGGVRWTMIVSPLPDEAEARRALLMHEAWHRIQPQLNLPMASPTPAHLATPEGRLLMRLEWRALASALAAGDAIALRTAINDALTFRAARRSQAGAEGAEAERALEMNEGLAEYTGVKLSGAADPRRDAALTLRVAEGADNFARTFAYASGPAYGLLLDELSPDWRDGLAADADLGGLLGAVVGYQPPQGDLAAPVQASAARYGGQTVADEEMAAAGGREAAVARYTARLVDGPVLTLPFGEMRIGFDPNTVLPLPPHGVVYPTLTLTDAWGELTVTDGALVPGDFSGAVVAAPANAGARQGEGWTLRLNDGWRIVAVSGGGFRVEAQ